MKNQDKTTKEINDKARHQFLVNEVRDHQRRYYRLNRPIISDGEFDLLFQELKRLEDRYPHLCTVDSPTQKVGY